MLIEVSKFITSSLFSQLYCTSIVAFTAYHFYNFRKTINPRIETLRDASTTLKSKSSLDEFSSEYHDFSTWAKGNSVLGHAWSEFEETLVMPDISADRKCICNTQDACCYFDENILFDKNINTAFYKALPNYLTGFGILGTFIGLVCGIYLASHGLASEDPQELKDALRQLLDGASLAFWTSIAGLAASIFFSYYEKRKINAATSALSEWNYELDRRILRITPEHIASEQLKQLTSQTIHLETFVNQVAFNIAEALDQRMSNTIVPVLERLAESMDSMSTNHAARNEDMLRDIVDNFRSTMTDAAGKEMEALSGTLSELQTTLTPLVREMQAAQSEMQGAATHITTQMGAFYEQTNREFSNGIARVTDSIGASVREARQLLHDDLSSAFSQTAARMEEAASSITERIGTSYDQCGKALTESVTGAVSHISDTVREAGQVLRGDLTEAFAHAAEHMREAVKAIEGTVEKVRASGEASGDAATKTGAMILQLVGLIERLQEHQASVTQAAAAIRQTAASLAETGTAVARAANSTDSSATTLRNASEQIRTTQQTLEGAWRAYDQRFEGVDAALDNVIRRLADSHKVFCDSTSEYMDKLDISVSKITGDIGATVKEFDESISELADAMNKFRR